MKPPLCICHGPKREASKTVYGWLDIPTNQWYDFHPSCPIHQEQIRDVKKMSERIYQESELSAADKLEAGRELDSLVAEKVMGFQVWTPATSIRERLMGSLQDLKSAKPVPPYSTDIAAAWAVVEKLRLDGFYFQITIPKIRTGDQTDHSIYLCRVIEDQQTEGKGRADSLPLAICRAALKGVGA